MVLRNSRYPTYDAAISQENGIVIAAVQYKLSLADNPAYGFIQAHDLTKPNRKRFLTMRELESLDSLLGNSPV